MLSNRANLIPGICYFWIAMAFSNSIQLNQIYGSCCCLEDSFLVYEKLDKVLKIEERKTINLQK